MKKYLIIETFPNTPHLETSLEIAQKLKKKITKYFFFGQDTTYPGKIGIYLGIKKFYYSLLKIKLKKFINI